MTIEIMASTLLLVSDTYFISFLMFGNFSLSSSLTRRTTLLRFYFFFILADSFSGSLLAALETAFLLLAEL